MNNDMRLKAPAGESKWGFEAMLSQAIVTNAFKNGLRSCGKTYLQARIVLVV